MKVLAIEKEVPGTVQSDYLPHLHDESAVLWELHQSGSIRELYFRSDRTEAVLVLECSDPDEASRILSALPLVKAGLIRFEVVGLRPYPGFARLFGTGKGASSDNNPKPQES